jgi:hypothetical protein
MMQRHILVFLATISLLLGVSATIGGQPAPARADTIPAGYGADVNPTGNPIGGGVGYNSIVEPSVADYVVSTRSQLLTALASATSGQIIYVDDSAEIDMTGSKEIPIPAGVTLASGRGRSGSPGGAIFTEQTSTSKSFPAFLKMSDGAKICGLRIYGPDGEIDASATNNMLWSGLKFNGASVEIFNCEVYNFPYAGIAAYNYDGGYVHHNYIHNCRRVGYGYGIEVAKCSILVEANKFDYGRHYIAGGRGYPTTNYEFRYNWLGANCTNTQIDCHGGNDISDPTSPAGGTLLIHHNTSIHTSQPLAGIRGVPETLCRVNNNWAYVMVGTQVNQQMTNLPQGYTATIADPRWVNMEVDENWFGSTPPPSTNNAPVLDAVGNKAVVELTTLAFSVSATDPDGDTLTYSASNLPIGATFDPATWTFTWTPQDGQSGVYASIRFLASDGSLSDTEDITITVSDGVQGDVNSDGAVNSLDMIRVGQHWNETGASGWIPEDINNDGTVNVLDATLIGQNWTG